MDRGAWRTTVHGVTKSLSTTLVCMMAQSCPGRAKAAIFWDNLWCSNGNQDHFYWGSRERSLSLVDFVLQITNQSIACIWVWCLPQRPHLYLCILVPKNRPGGLEEAPHRRLSKHMRPMPLNWLQPPSKPFSLTGYPLQCPWAYLVVQLVKNLPEMQEMLVQSLDWEDPLEKGKATHSRILAWRIPWTV